MAASPEATSAPAAGSTVAVDRTLGASTEPPFVVLNNQNGDASGMTSAPSVGETAPAAATAPGGTGSVSICVHGSSLPFPRVAPVSPHLLSWQPGVSCVGPEEVTKSRYILVEVETAECVSDFPSFLLSFVMQSSLLFTAAQMETVVMCPLIWGPAPEDTAHSTERKLSDAF